MSTDSEVGYSENDLKLSEYEDNYFQSTDTNYFNSFLWICIALTVFYFIVGALEKLFKDPNSNYSRRYSSGGNSNSSYNSSYDNDCSSYDNDYSSDYSSDDSNDYSSDDSSDYSSDFGGGESDGGGSGDDW